MVQQLKNYYHLFQAVIAGIIYGFPSRKLKVIGITGTDGKTTTTSLIYHILKASGKKVSMISTIFAEVGGKVYDTGFHVTTPSPFTVQRFLKEAVDHGDEYFVLETTSHALDQFRVYGVKYHIGLITNITHEHLLYHKTYDRYVEAKIRLLEMSEIKIVNKDDQSYEKIVRRLGLKNEKSPHSFAIKEKAVGTTELVADSSKSDTDYRFDISQKIGIPLPDFNKYNYLAAYSVCKALKLTDDQIFSAMKSFKLPAGRMETIYQGNFKVILDFAHTPNAIFEAMKAIREQHPKQRLIHIFGSASQRDDSKRPLMGEASGEFTNLTIVTEEDHRLENPENIAKQIGAGLDKKGFHFVESVNFGTEDKTYTIITSRAEAIAKAVQMAQLNDVIILTGKGHEKSLNRYGTEYPWDDKTTTMDEIKKQGK